MGSLSRDRILEIVYASVGEFNQRLGPEARLPLEAETLLYGADGPLDSLQLVQLIVATEQRIEDELGVSLTLADERALARKSSPFRSVGTLVDYVGERLEGEAK